MTTLCCSVQSLGILTRVSHWVLNRKKRERKINQSAVHGKFPRAGTMASIIQFRFWNLCAILFHYLKPTEKVNSGHLCYISGTLGICGMNSERKCCPRSSRLWDAFHKEREWCLGVLEATGKHAAASTDSGADKTKPHMPKGSKKKPEPATILTLTLEGVVWMWNVPHQLMCLSTRSLGGGCLGEDVEAWGNESSLKEVGCWMVGPEIIAPLLMTYAFCFRICFDASKVYPRSWSCPAVTNWSSLKALATINASSLAPCLSVIWSQWWKGNWPREVEVLREGRREG